MKSVFYAIVVLLAHMPVSFAGNISLITNGVYVAVTESSGELAVRTNEPFKVSEKLLWAAYCNTGRVSLWRPIDPAYGARIKLLDANGNYVAKTSLGKAYGAKWDNLHSYRDTMLRPIDAWGSFEDNHGESTGGILPAPQELFIMEKPGVYAMEIELQVFRYVASKDEAEWQRNLIRFSSIRIQVEKH